MKHLYAPWREDYTEDTAHTKNEGVAKSDCLFCTQLQAQDDKKYFIIKRYPHTFVLLNRFPYNAGHLLLLPTAHAATLDELTPDARAELMELATKSYTIMMDTLDAHGVNMGLNFGKASGAGIPSHLHMHVLPRWYGDTNFLPTLTQTKQISVDLHKMYQRLKAAFENILL